MLGKTPAGVVDILGVKGIGPKKVQMLWKDLGIETLGELLYACEENRLAQISGIGAKTQANVKEQVLYLLANQGKHLWGDIEGEVKRIVADLSKQKHIAQAALSGPMRRLCPVPETIDILLAVEPECNLPDIFQTLALTVVLSPPLPAPTLSTWQLRTQGGLLLTIYSCPPRQFARHWLQTSASPEHLAQIGLAASPQTTDDEADTEAAIYTRLNLPFVLPELRDTARQLEWACHNNADQLIDASHIKGILHAHSTYSDGVNTLKDMAVACKNAGYQYLGISDHSISAFYAGGLKPERIIAQHQEIDLLNEQLHPFRLFKGIEADILGDGRLDYTNDILASFDFVIASIHANLFMDEAKAMSRLIKAIENPYTTILGHPTGRLLLTRQGYPINHNKIIEACADNGVIIELNANPRRLDIDYRYLEYCMTKGVKISINPDAHSIAAINHLQYGINAARKGLLTHDFTFNTLDAEALNKHFTARKALADKHFR